MGRQYHDTACSISEPAVQAHQFPVLTQDYAPSDSNRSVGRDPCFVQADDVVPSLSLCLRRGFSRFASEIRNEARRGMNLMVLDVLQSEWRVYQVFVLDMNDESIAWILNKVITLKTGLKMPHHT